MKCRKRFQRVLSLFFVMVMCFSIVLQYDVYGAKTYEINGKKVSVNDFSSSPNECWVYANHLYRKIWGENFSNSFSDTDNMLRKLPDSELTLTPEHLKAYVSQAELGSCLRICNSEYLHGTDGWGHSQIIVQKDANGFTVLQGGLSAYPYKNEAYYTWEGYCNTRWLGKYKYIKYIKWPGAHAYGVDRAPKGSHEEVVGGSGTIRVQGWAYDPDTPDTEVVLHIYVDGSFASSCVANQPRNDIGDSLGCGNNHGFDHTFEYNSPGEHKVDIYAINTKAGGNSALLENSSKVVTVQPKPAPVVTNITISEVTEAGYKVICDVSGDDGDVYVKVGAGPYIDGTCDMKWYDAQVNGNSAECYVKTSDFNNSKNVIYANCVDAYNSYDLHNTYEGPQVRINESIEPTKTASYNDSEYFLFTVENSPWSWEAAESYCESLGGHLVSITSEEEQAVVEELMKEGAMDGYWIGGSDKKSEGNWRWSSSQRMKYTNWAPNQPDGAQEENYLLMMGDGTWNDMKEAGAFSGNMRIGFIMEISKAEPIQNPFSDVEEDDYYYHPVLWALNQNITTGTAADAFGPKEVCTRGQVVTFLWRSQGCPEPASATMQFEDVDDEAYYYKAVLWAAENGITTGTSQTAFSPKDEITRAQMVTFLWRLEGEQEPVHLNTAFKDVDPDRYYYKAVSWAAEQEITTGISVDEFGTDNPCLRSEVVTFLYRAYA